jgi:hypothetical protein
MSDNNEELPKLEVELLRQKLRIERKQIALIRRFNITHWLAGVLGIIILSQAVSFGRWNEFVSTENNFNEHSILLAGCGLAIILFSVSTFVLNKRIQRIEECIMSKE